MIEKTIQVKDYLSISKLPDTDYVINPYVGCPHGCKYCYASFMKRFTNHEEAWGEFIDIKLCNQPLNLTKLKNKSVLLSSVTDCYNPYEEKYLVTQGILKQLMNADCRLTIITKSQLILRDLEILKKIKNLKVAISINTMDEQFRSDMDQASSINERMNTLKTLHEQGIYTILFMSPMFPYITDFKAIIEETKNYVNEYWFENLNLRGDYKYTILKYIALNYPQYQKYYHEIYVKKNLLYWEQLAIEINSYCQENKINYKNYFYHEQLVANKK